jgi:hypothetical protein
MHVLFCPAYDFDDVMDQVIKEVNIDSKDLVDAGVSLELRNDVPQLLQKFAKLMKAAILDKVKSIAMDFAKQIANERRSTTYSQVQYHQPKKARLSILKTVSASQRDNPELRNNAAIISADNIVNNEMDEYLKMIGKTDGLCADPKCQPGTIARWWANNDALEKFPCLSRVACALYGMLPGSGGLECDIGGVSDMVQPKRGSLSAGIIEAMMSVRLNKTLVERDITIVKDLGRQWEKSIPKVRDRDFPDEYYENLQQFDENHSMFDAAGDGESGQHEDGNTPVAPDTDGEGTYESNC